MHLAGFCAWLKSLGIAQLDRLLFAAECNCVVKIAYRLASAKDSMCYGHVETLDIP